MPHATKTEHEEKATSNAEEHEATLPKCANRTDPEVEDDKAAPHKRANKITSNAEEEAKATPPKPPKKPTAKVEKYEEATIPRPAKKTRSKVDVHTLPYPNLSPKDLHWRCCCEHDNYGGEFPQLCKKCTHPWCENCPISWSGGKVVLGVWLRD